jgi:hypothetical protein
MLQRMWLCRPNNNEYSEIVYPLGKDLINRRSGTNK